MKKLFLSLFCASVLTAANAELTGNIVLDNLGFEQMDSKKLNLQAATGNKHAQFFLAKRLQKGEGIAKDASKAAYWYERAAKQGVAPAQLNLGIMYLRGEGVAYDIDKAKVWLEQAAQLGDNRATYALAVLDEREKRLVDAYKWYDLSTRETMLDDKVKSRAKDKIGQLAMNLSSSEIESAKNQANRWFQDK